MKNIAYKTYNYNIPFEITCTVSGQVKVYTSEDFINGKIDRFGGLDKLREKYVCRDAERLLKGGMKPEEVKAHLNNKLPVPRLTVVKAPASPKTEIAVTTVSVPEVKLDPVRPLKDVTKPLTKETASAETCYNPSFKLNGNPCTNCAMKNICLHADSPKGKLAAMKKASKKVKVAA